AADRLAADGGYAMAAELIEFAETMFPGSDSLERAKRFAYLKLMERIRTRIRSNSSSIRQRLASRRHKLMPMTLRIHEERSDEELGQSAKKQPGVPIFRCESRIGL